MPDPEPTNAVLLEKIENLKEDVREQGVELHDFRDAVETQVSRIEQAVADAVQKFTVRQGQVDVQIEQNRGAIHALSTAFLGFTSGHAKLHEDDAKSRRFTITTIIAIVAAVAVVATAAFAFAYH